MNFRFQARSHQVNYVTALATNRTRDAGSATSARYRKAKSPTKYWWQKHVQNSMHKRQVSLRRLKSQ